MRPIQLNFKTPPEKQALCRFSRKNVFEKLSYNLQASEKEEEECRAEKKKDKEVEGEEDGEEARAEEDFVYLEK